MSSQAACVMLIFLVLSMDDTCVVVEMAKRSLPRLMFLNLFFCLKVLA